MAGLTNAWSRLAPKERCVKRIVVDVVEHQSDLVAIHM